MNAARLTAWEDFKAEVSAIKRTQANIGPVPMDLVAFSKGKAKGAKNAWEKVKGKGKENKGKGKKGACYNCGSPDHMQNQCPKGKEKEEKRKERRK
eukprot:6281621-Amphidinium_carterae.1